MFEIGIALQIFLIGFNLGCMVQAPNEKIKKMFGKTSLIIFGLLLLSMTISVVMQLRMHN